MVYAISGICFMKDLIGLMSKAKEVQKKMQSMQEELAQLNTKGVSGGGMVAIEINGKGIVTSVSIDPSLIEEKQELGIIEDLVMAAHNDAKSKMEQMKSEKTKEITSGLPLPAGMTLPF